MRWFEVALTSVLATNRAFDCHDQCVDSVSGLNSSALSRRHSIEALETRAVLSAVKQHHLTRLGTNTTFAEISNVTLHCRKCRFRHRAAVESEICVWVKLATLQLPTQKQKFQFSVTFLHAENGLLSSVEMENENSRVC